MQLQQPRRTIRPYCTLPARLFHGVLSISAACLSCHPSRCHRYPRCPQACFGRGILARCKAAGQKGPEAYLKIRRGPFWPRTPQRDKRAVQNQNACEISGRNLPGVIIAEIPPGACNGVVGVNPPTEGVIHELGHGPIIPSFRFCRRGGPIPRFGVVGSYSPIIPYRPHTCHFPRCSLTTVSGFPRMAR